MRPFDTGGSFRTQLVALTAIVTAVGVVALTVLVQVLLARSTTRSVDTVLADRAEAVISSAVSNVDGTLVVPDERLDAGVAVFDSDGELTAGNVPSAESGLYAALAAITTRTSTDRPGPNESRVLAEPFTTSEGASGVVVVTERLAPYERAESQALLVCIGAGLLMIAMSAGLSLWVSHRALVPVAEMTRAADDWSEHDLTHRFDPGPGANEIAGLGRTLDRLLERVAVAIRSEQRLTSELAHELRTPLTAIQANADLVLLHDLPDLTDDVRDSLDEIASSARRMGTTIESLLELARTSSAQALSGSCSLREAVAEALASPEPLDGSVVNDVGPGLRVLLPATLTVRAVSPILDNARRLAGRVVVSTTTSRAGYVDLCIDDDGPGIAPDARESVFEPGHTTGTGAGLGLALARRVARSMGGDVNIVDGPMTTRVVVTLPSAHDSHARDPAP